MHRKKHQTHANNCDETLANKSCDYYASNLHEGNGVLSADAQWRTPGCFTSESGWGHLYSTHHKKIVAFKIYTRSVNWDGSSGAMDPAALKHNLNHLYNEYKFVPKCVIVDADAKSNLVLQDFNKEHKSNTLRGLGMFVV